MAPYAPNHNSAESQTHNKKLRNHDPPSNIAAQQAGQTKFKQNTNYDPPLDSKNPYSQHYQSNAAIWALYLKETKAEQKEHEQLLQLGSDLLVFAGLLGAIVTAFLIESRKNLTEDPLQSILYVLRNNSTTTSKPFKPTKSSLVVNAAWFSSLALTLMSALAAVLARGWLANYTPATSGLSSNDACEHHLRSLRTQQWRLRLVVAGIPLFIQIAVFLFAIGLVILTLNDNLGLGILLFVLTIFATFLYFFGTILPWYSPACPFQTTMSDFIPGIAMKHRYMEADPTTPPKPLSLRESVSVPWNEFTHFLIETHRKPDQLEIEANILAWMLTSRTKEDVIEEAVKAIAGAKPSPYLRAALEKYDATTILIDRFAQCVEVVPGLPITGDEQCAEAYLYAMLRIVELYDEGDQNKVLFMKESLLEVGQPLHRWENYMASLQPLAFALRTKILLATGCDDDSLEWEGSERDLMKMATMGLLPCTRWVLLNAAVGGLLGGKKHVRKMSALVLAKQLQIADTRNILGSIDRADKVALEMAEILEESGDPIILEGIMRMARSSEFKNSISTVIRKIISLLKHKEMDVRVAAEDALLRLKEQVELRKLIDTGIPDIVNLLRVNNVDVHMAVGDTLWKLAKEVEFQPSILTAVTTLLKDSDEYIQEAGGNVLWKLSEHVEFRPLIEALIPYIIKCLNNSSAVIQEAGADALSKLSVYAEFRPLIMPAIPEINTLLKVQDPHWYVRKAGADALSKLSEHVEFRPSILTAIPKIITLFMDDEKEVQKAGTDAFSKLSGHAEFQPLIGTAIPKIITLLKANQRHVRIAGLDALLTLSYHTEFQPYIKTAIPEIITLLKDNYLYIRKAGADTLLKLAEQTEFRPWIKTHIPDIVKYLNDSSWAAREAGSNVLSRLSVFAEFHPLIEAAIPQIITLLKDSTKYVRGTGVDALSKFSEQTKFQPLIKTAIPEIIILLKDNAKYVQKAAVDALSRFSEQAKFQPLIETAIPEIVTLLMDNMKNVRKAGVDALSKLSEYGCYS